jgi:protein TonB
MTRPGFAANDRLLPALLLAAAIHAGMGYGMRFDIPSPPSATGPLDVVLLPASLERGSAASGMPPAAAPRPEPDPSTGEDSGLVGSRSAPDVPPAGAATAPTVTPRQTVPEPRRADASAWRPRALDFEDSAASEAESPWTNQALDPVPGTEPGDAGQSEPPAEPVRLTADTLDQQISEWTAGYTQAQQAESRQPSRTAYIEHVASHRYLASAYERAWQDKVERVGNLNYPEEARRKSLTGGLLMSVAVNADGTIQSIKIRQSSGHAELDQAAERIVRLAAPFAVFPSELKKDYDVLLITRTWRFLIDNRLSTTP